MYASCSFFAVVLIARALLEYCLYMYCCTGGHVDVDPPCPPRSCTKA